MAARQNTTKGANGAEHGELSGRLRELFAKTVVPEPYAVTDKISVAPPTKGGWAELDALQAHRSSVQLLIAEAWNRLGTENGPTKEDFDELNKQATDAETRYNELFFGPNWPKIQELSKSWQREQWNDFVQDIRAHFLGQGPDDGKCPRCGHVDEEQAGKGSKPSTSSSTTGT